MNFMVPEQRQGEMRGSSESWAAMWQMRQKGKGATELVDPVKMSMLDVLGTVVKVGNICDEDGDREDAA